MEELIRPTDFRLFRDVPLDPTQEHTIWFQDAETQYQFFLDWPAAKSVPVADNSYQRIGTNKIRIQKPIIECYNCNYLRIWNGWHRETIDYEHKNYYCFITAVNYINDNTTEIEYQIDVIQTFMFDFDFGMCFLEREIINVSDDLPYSRMLDEGLEHGEYIVNGTISKCFDWTNLGGYCICVVVSEVYDSDSGEWVPAQANTFGNIYSGCAFLAKTFLQLQAMVLQYTQAGKTDAILNMFMCPNFLFTTDTQGNKIPKIGVQTRTKSIQAPLTINGYTPKNKRLLGWPYSFCHVIDNQGRSGDFKYEFWESETPQQPIGRFTLNTCMAPNPELSLSPAYYKGAAENYNETMYIDGLPTCAWNIDTFKAWYAMNANSIDAKRLSINLSETAGIINTVSHGLISGGVSAVTGNVAGAVASAAGIVTGLAGTEISKQAATAALDAEIKDHAILPAHAKGQASTSLAFSKGLFDFCVMNMSITKEYAEIIDHYFDRYGYKINKSKIPNLHHYVSSGVRKLTMPRPRWYFVKMVGCTIENSRIPGVYSTQLCSIFERGITFWRNAADVGNYSLDNRTSTT